MPAKLLDATILIDLSRGNLTAADWIDRERETGAELFVSVISAMELVAGCRDKTEVASVEKMIADFLFVHVHPPTSRKAYELMLAHSKSHGLKIPDALIAATALLENFELMTDNERHFRMIENLKVTRPYIS